nr:hypothetical protein GCM10025730_41500 [Promicromonospora thailandica]
MLAEAVRHVRVPADYDNFHVRNSAPGTWAASSLAGDACLSLLGVAPLLPVPGTNHLPSHEPRRHRRGSDLAVERSG